LSFISASFPEESFERMQSHTDDEKLSFKSYEKFLEHNKKCVSKLEEKDIKFILALCDTMLKGEIRMTDEEDFVEWKPVALYYNKKKKLVITHPR
jgi:hypothetical protein